MNKKIVLTGGHAATAALAVVEELEKSKDPKWEMIWIGTKQAIEGKKLITLENKIFNKYKIKDYYIISGRLQRKWSKYSVHSLLKVPVGFLMAFILLLRIKPDLILSFGGFISFPIVVCAWALGIPIVIHEQTAAIGLANQLSAPFAKVVAISRTQSSSYFHSHKTKLVGNPVRLEIRSINPKNNISTIPLLYITGGSRGSQILNKTVKEALPDLLKDYKIIHQTGDLDEKEFFEFKKSLPSNFRNKYTVKGTISPNDVSKIFANADIIVSRAGANTVSEIIMSKTPSILVPIPWTRYDEQTKNAHEAVKAGIALIIEQDKLNKELLVAMINKVRKNWKVMHELKDDTLYNLDKNAAHNLAVLAGSLFVS